MFFICYLKVFEKMGIENSSTGLENDRSIKILL